MKQRIALLMNWKNRDLRACIQLSIILEQKGYKTKIIPHGAQTTPLTEIKKFAPHLVVFPQVEGEDHLVRYVKNIGAKIIVLHTEGTWNEDTAISFFHRSKKIYGDNYPVEMDFVWGKEMKQLFLENNIFEEDQVKIVGSPRFDVYRDPLKQLIMPKEEFVQKYDLDENKPILVWATNFVNVDREEKELDYVEEFTEIDVRQVNAIQRSLQEKNFDALMKLMEDFPNCEYIIKPHPLEIPDYYINESQKRGLDDKITVINEETIENVLNATSIFFHTNSTASTEAWMMDIPSITLLFEKKAEANLSYFADGNEQVSDYNTLKTLVTEYLNGTHEIPEKIIQARKDFISRFYYKIDGNSTKRAADAIDNYMKNNNIKDISTYLTSDILIEQFKVSIFFNLIRKIYFTIRGEKSYWAKIAEKDKVTEDEIQDLKSEIKMIYTQNNYLSS